MGAAAAGALGASMLVPAPWRAAFGQAKPFKIGHAPAPVGHGGGGRQDRAGGRADGGGPDQQVGRDQRPAHRAHRRRLRVQARRGAAQGGEARGRGQDRRPCRRLSVQRVPGLHAGVRGAQARQHDHGVPRHHHHHEQVQPVHLPALRLRARAGGGRRRRTWSTRWARSGTSPSPTTRGGSPPRTPSSAEIKKNGGEVVGTIGMPARHRRHDARSCPRSAGASTGSSASSSGPRASPSSTRASTSGCPRSTSIAGDGAIAVSVNLPAMGTKAEGFVGHRPVRPAAGGRAQHARTTRSFLEDSTARLKAIDPTGPCPTATCSRTTRASTRSRSACRSRASAGARTR